MRFEVIEPRGAHNGQAMLRGAVIAPDEAAAWVIVRKKLEYWGRYPEFWARLKLSPTGAPPLDTDWR